MTLFDSARSILNEAFGALYPDALLHRKVRGADTAGGSATATFSGLGGVGRATPVKATKSRMTKRILEAEGYAEGDVAFIILTAYEGSGLPEPMPGDRMTYPKDAGSLYSLEVPIDLDDAGSHWTARGRPVR